MVGHEPERVLRATIELTKSHTGFLTLGHLRKAVNDFKGNWAAYEEFERLPSKPVDRETAKKHIEELKKLLAN